MCGAGAPPVTAAASVRVRRPGDVHLQHGRCTQLAGEGARLTFIRSQKGKGQSDFSDWPLFMPATTYAPTHLARAVPSALRGLTSVFGMGTGGSPAVRSPTSRGA
jgi:hypothetical protein